MPISVSFKSTQSFTGRFTATPDQNFINYEPTPDEIVLSGIPFVATITAGAATLSLPASDQNGQSVTYWFKVEQGASAPFTLIDECHAVVKSTPSTQNYFDLARSYFTLDKLEQSRAAILQGLIDYLNSGGGGSLGFQFLGSWNSTTFYKKNQFVERDGKLWGYINAIQTQNKDPIDPLNSAFWTAALIPVPGSIAASTIGYNHATFGGQTTIAASRSDVQGAAAYAIANSAPDLSAYAQLAGATFTGAVGVPNPSGSAAAQDGQAFPRSYADARYARLASNNTLSGSNTLSGANNVSGSITVPDRTLGDNTANAANTKFVASALAAFTPTRIAAPVAWVRRSAAQALTAGSANTINWDDYPITGGFGTSGDWTCPATGRYLFKLMPITFQANNNQSVIGDRMRLKCFLEINGVDVGDFFLDDQESTLATFQRRYNADRLETVTAGQIVRIRLTPSSTGGTTITGATISAGVANNILSVWRVD